MKAQTVLLILALASGSALAKLPPPSDEAKAKAAETAARTAWSEKVAAYQLCQAMDRVAATYLERSRAEGKAVTPVQTPPCSDPGPFAYAPADPKPLEASEAHSPPQTAATAPSTPQPAAEQDAAKEAKP